MEGSHPAKDKRIKSLALLAEDLNSLNIDYVFIGGAAVHIWTPFRPIRDLDVLIEGASPYEVQCCLRKYNPVRYDLSVYDNAGTLESDEFSMAHDGVFTDIDVMLLDGDDTTDMTWKNIILAVVENVPVNVFHPNVLLIEKIWLSHNPENDVPFDGPLEATVDLQDALALVEFLKSLGIQPDPNETDIRYMREGYVDSITEFSAFFPTATEVLINYLRAIRTISNR